MADQHKESGRRLRVRERRRYTEEYGDEEDLLFGCRAFDVDEKLKSDAFDPKNGNDFVRQMTGEELTVSYIQQNGFENPIIVKQMKGLGMKIPPKEFTVSDVKQCVGSRRVLDVMDVHTQRDFTMSMKEWCNYYEDSEKKQLLNVISLEFSHTKLEQYVDSPHIVKQVDWIDWVWPKHLKQSQTEGTNAIEDMKYPKVQKYCLMSVKGCYTDFHIDFGGTSVWYHILKGRKVFWLIPPTERNIQSYEEWVLSGKQSDIFFGDQVEHCARIELEAGNTFFIPTGWIHAVFTPDDSLVFGGNFLHSFSIEKQLRVAQVEDNTKVPGKFRYPFYTEVLWYVLARYVYCLMDKNHLKCNEDGLTVNKDNDINDVKPSITSSQPTFKSSVHLTPFELKGIKAIIERLETLPSNKKSVPELLVSAEKLLNNAKILIDEHQNDSHQMAVTGRPVLFWTKKSTTSYTSITSQLRSIKSPSFALKQMRNKETPVVSPLARPESPPTRPISSNQYSITSGSTLNQDMIPSSFAGLIAQTGVNHFQPFIPLSTAPLLCPIGSPPAVMPQMSVSYMAPTLPRPPPLISTNAMINPMANSYQTTTHTQTIYTSLPQKDFISENMNHIENNCNPIDKKPLNGKTSESNPDLINSYVSTTNASNFANFFVNSSPLKRSSPPVMTVMETQTQTTRPFPAALPPSGFHSTGIQSEPFVNKMVNSSTQSSFPTNQKLLVSTGAGTTGKSNSNDSSRRRRTRCKKCDSCLRADCGECHFCKDMKKFGGPGRMKQSCIARQCLAPVLPHTACCMICGRDGWEKLVDPSINDETASSLMECSQCWEIVHPFCLNEKFPQFLSSDANLNEDLPNSWECPRCVKTGSKNGKYIKSKTTSSTNCSFQNKSNNTISGETDVSPEKKSRLSADDSPPGSEDEEDIQNEKSVNNSNNNGFENNRRDDEMEDTDNSSSSSHIDGNNTSNSYLSKPLSIMASTSAHVRSCARFPLLSQGLKQINSTNNGSNFLSKNNNFSVNNNKSEAKGLAALMPKKKNESSRDRLFKSIKGLKKSSEHSVRFGSNTSTQNKKSHKSNSCSTTTSSSNSSVSSPVFNQNSQSLSPCPLMSSSSTSTNDNNFNSINGKNFAQIKHEIQDESTDDEVDDRRISTKLSNDSPSKRLRDPLPKRELVKPKYVVRPAPLDCDISESEQSEESSDESNNESDDNKNEIKKLKKIRNKAKQKYFRKFCTKLSDNKLMERDVMLPVFQNLSKPNLLNCMRVCKSWNGFAIDPKLWPIIDMSHKKITSTSLVGIVRRQPKHLTLSWTNITRRQLFWLICRLPYLQSLSLVGCNSSVVSALYTCNCPRMESLDISWCEGVNDDLIAELLSPPNDSRPGLMETKTRLRFLAEFRIAGSNISDKSIRLIAQNLPFIRRIDISNCTQITDIGIAVLATTKGQLLTHLNLSACTNISNMSLDTLRRCPAIELLDVRECPEVTRNACHQFVSQFLPSTKLICN